MTAEELVRQYFTHMGEGRGREAFALLSEDVSYRVMGTTPISGEAKGIGGVLTNLIRPFTSRLEGGKIDLIPDEYIASGSTVVVLAHSQATGTTGLPYQNEYAMVFRTNGDRITGITEYLDTALVETAVFGKTLVEAG